jgi:hypothetical protein
MRHPARGPGTLQHTSAVIGISTPSTLLPPNFQVLVTLSWQARLWDLPGFRRSA